MFHLWQFEGRVPALVCVETQQIHSLRFECLGGRVLGGLHLLAQNLVGPRVLGRPPLLPLLIPLGGSAGPWSGQMFCQAKVSSSLSSTIL